jgi:hypothetical protein
MYQRPQKPLHLFKAMELKQPKVKGEYLISEKIDGIFVCIDYCPEQGIWQKPKSFAQRIIPALEHIDLNNKKLSIGRTCRLIFEASIPGMEFHQMNGVLNRKYELATDVKLWLHDIYIPGTLAKASERWKQVEELALLLNIDTVPLLGCSADPANWQRWFEQVVDAGGEGVVGKQVHSLYVPEGRNESMIKIKEEITKDLLCVGITEGIGKKGEPSINLTLRSKAGIDISVVVPKDADQFLYRLHPEKAIGHVFEVKAMKELVGGQLREPRLKVRRDDKSAEDID